MSPSVAFLAALCLAATSNAAKLQRQERNSEGPPAYRAVPAPQNYQVPLKDLDGDGYEDDKVELDPDALRPINYKFSYNVEDGEIGNYQNRKEVRDGLETYGEYSYIDPYGVLRTVKYTSHPIHGYQAKEYEQQTSIIPKPPPKKKEDAYGRTYSKSADGYVVAPPEPYRQ